MVGWLVAGPLESRRSLAALRALVGRHQTGTTGRKTDRRRAGWERSKEDGAHMYIPRLPSLSVTCLSSLPAPGRLPFLGRSSRPIETDCALGSAAWHGTAARHSAATFRRRAESITTLVFESTTPTARVCARGPPRCRHTWESPTRPRLASDQPRSVMHDMPSQRGESKTPTPLMCTQKMTTVTMAPLTRRLSRPLLLRRSSVLFRVGRRSTLFALSRRRTWRDTSP